MYLGTINPRLHTHYQSILCTCIGIPTCSTCTVRPCTAAVELQVYRSTSSTRSIGVAAAAAAAPERRSAPMVTAWHPLLLLIGLAGCLGGGCARGCHYATQCLSGPCGPGGPCRSTSSGTACPARQCGEPAGPVAPRFHAQGSCAGSMTPTECSGT